MTAEGYLRAYSSGGTREFVMAHATMSHYSRVVLRHADLVLPTIAASGVTLVQNATLADVTALCSERYRVVTLFSHANELGVELDSGMVSFEDLSAAIPNTFSGILDLSVCEATAQIRKVRSATQQFLLKTNERPETVSLWLYFYSAMFSIMKQNHVDYFDALLKAEDLFYKRLK